MNTSQALDQAPREALQPEFEFGHGASTEEADGLRTFSRTPRPYLQHGLDVTQHPKTEPQPQPQPRPQANAGDLRDSPESPGDDGDDSQREWRRPSGTTSASSESGTEADDERAHFVRALPSSALRPRKGLKTGEQDEDTLLTPSQLDEKERELRGYFSAQRADTRERGVQREHEDHDKIVKRRWAEFVRRTSEVALMGLLLAAVLCGDGVATTAWAWRRELLAHLVAITTLILAYPLKLSIVGTAAAATHTSVWQRFRVPASFDPATLLYPPLLPVLVALSVAPSNPAILLPNVILGLASLPQRLFPQSSRLGGLNSVHWLLALAPLVVSQHTLWPPHKLPPAPYSIKAPGGVSPETLVSLYPLHHALLQPLHYLTTTSLLISELHLLSAVLINTLLLVSSPQAVIIKSCLWIGGILFFLTCGPTLHWNVTLARIPRWKLRRPGHTADERKSLVDAVSDLISLQRTASAFNANAHAAESDADDDLPSISIKPKALRKPMRKVSELVIPTFNTNMFGPNLAAEQRPLPRGALSGQPGASSRPRRNTLPEREPPKTVEAIVRRKSSRKKAKASQLAWYLHLTPKEAEWRKWIYAGYVYVAILAIILAPVRWYVSHRALYHQEPIGWALGYLFGQIPRFHSTVTDLGWDAFVILPQPANLDWRNLPLSIPLHIDLVRFHLGAANIRLLLIVYWAAVLIVGLITVFSLTAFVEVDTRRKVFHGVMVAMILPSTFVDPCFCALAMALILAIFLILEAIRAGQVPPLGSAIGRFVAPYVDGRDLRGPVVVSHIFLLIGCAVPLWLSLASIERAGQMPWKGWELLHSRREVAMISGVVCVGMGDAAASLIGRRYGRHKWIWVGGKSLEGSAAFAVAVTIGLLAARAWQQFGGWNDDRRIAGADWTMILLDWIWATIKAIFCACGASFMEAVLTGANDNVVVPVALWLLVKGVRL